MKLKEKDLPRAKMKARTRKQASIRVVMGLRVAILQHIKTKTANQLGGKGEGRGGGRERRWKEGEAWFVLVWLIICCFRGTVVIVVMVMVVVVVVVASKDS